MKTLYFDCGGGASGDMLLSSLVDAGASFGLLTSTIDKFNIDGLKAELSRVNRNSLSCAHIDILYKHEHAHRHLSHIEKMIDDAGIEEEAAKDAKAIFRKLAEAEASVHGTTIEKVHFHEVGAVDAIVDITGVCVLIRSLKADRIIVSPLPYGYGGIKAAHGIMPNPAPATAALFKGVPTYPVDVEGEMVTPTAAAILSYYADEFRRGVEGKVESIGYGAGTKEYEGSIGMLRLSIIASEETKEKDMVISCNIDDMKGEDLSFVIDCIFENGANDVWLSPIIMKKTRAAHTLNVLCSSQNEEILTREIFKHTSTFGLRKVFVTKETLDRGIDTVDTVYGRVSVKYAIMDGEIVKAKVEHEEAAILAKKAGVSIEEVKQEALRIFKDKS